MSANGEGGGGVARLLGLDPGLRNTGWGLIDVAGNRMRHVANGVLHSTSGLELSRRLLELHEGVAAIIERYRPDAAAAEETFVNKNPDSTLKLGLARGAVLLAPARAGIEVFEYAPNRVKKSVVGVGHADKAQVQMMVSRLLPDCRFESPDAADALAVAICHAHFAQSARAHAARTTAAIGASPRASGRARGRAAAS